MDERKRRDAEDAGKTRREHKENRHPAGPHAKPELTNPDATPGAGALPDDRDGDDVDNATG